MGFAVPSHYVGRLPSWRRMAAVNRQELAELLEVLICPVCRKSLVIRSEDSLKCNDCKRVYPIRDGIVIMLESYATIEQI